MRSRKNLPHPTPNTQSILEHSKNKCGIDSSCFSQSVYILSKRSFDITRVCKIFLTDESNKHFLQHRINIYVFVWCEVRNMYVLCRIKALSDVKIRLHNVVSSVRQNNYILHDQLLK